MSIIRNSILLLAILATLSVFAQEAKQIVISKAYNDLSWNDFVAKAEAEHQVRFFYHTDSIPDIRMEVQNDHADLLSVIERNLRPYGFKVAMDRDGHIFVTKYYRINTAVTDGFFDAVQPEEEEDTAKAVETDYLKTRKELFYRDRVGYTCKRRYSGNGWQRLCEGTGNRHGY